MSSDYSNESINMQTLMDNADEDAFVDGEEFADSGVAGQFEHHLVGDDGVRDGAFTDPIDAVHPHRHSMSAPPPGVDFSTACSPSQLTLSFHGEVYVFDDVSAEKVQAVLLLLGGYEVPGGDHTGLKPQNQRSAGDVYGRAMTPTLRAAALRRFREKKKDRCFEKKIRYTVRKEVAHRMKRNKGQFVSSKASSEDIGSGSSDGNAYPGAVKEEHETSCKNCGTGSKHTPMMRRGPEGPRTLCNACGLKWANKVVLGQCPRN
uniref:GATA transcription factor n=1 Tax=Kalanchoe fedtschenkoi TaxID=63787 RepID=A0A7N0USM6_KALFE